MWSVRVSLACAFGLIKYNYLRIGIGKIDPIHTEATRLLHRRRRARQRDRGGARAQRLAALDLNRDRPSRARAGSAALPSPSRPRALADAGRPTFPGGGAGAARRGGGTGLRAAQRRCPTEGR